MASLRRDLVSLFMARGVGVLIPLMSLPYLTRVLRPEGFGRFALGLAISGMVTMVVKFGFDMSSLREGSIVSQDKVRFGQVLWETWLVQVCLWLLACVCAGLWWALVGLDSEGTVLLLVAVVGAAVTALYPQWALQALGYYRFSATLAVASRVVMLLLTFWLVREPDDYVLALVLQLAWVIPAGVISLVMLSSAIGGLFRSSTMGRVFTRAKSSFPFFMSIVFGSTYTVMNVLYLGWFGGSPFAIGHYAAAQQITDATRIPADPIKQAFFPRLARAADAGTHEFASLRRRYASLLLVGYIVIAVATLLLAEPIVNVYLGAGYEAATTLVQVSAISLIPWSLCVLMETLLQSQGLVRRSLLGPIIGSIAHLSYVGWFIHEWGAVGLAVAMVVTQFVIMSVLGIQTFRQPPRIRERGRG